MTQPQSGAGRGIRFSRELRARSSAVANVHRKFALYRFPFESLITKKRGVFVFDEDTHALRLKNEFFDLRAGYANPILQQNVAEVSSRPLVLRDKSKHHPRGMVFTFMAQEEGFEPPWLFRPNGFQDRLVVTASIFLRINMMHFCSYTFLFSILRIFELKIAYSKYVTVENLIYDITFRGGCQCF